MTAPRARVALLIGLATAGASAAAAGADAPAPSAARGLALAFGRASLSLEARALILDGDLRHPRDARDCLGPDPTAIAALPSGGFAVALRRPRQLLVLDDAGEEQARLDLDGDPRALAVDAAGRLRVATQDPPALLAFARDERREGLQPLGAPLPFGDDGARALATAGACLYGADEAAAQLVWTCAETPLPQTLGRTALPRGPSALVASPHHLLVTSPIAHQAVLFALGPDGAPRELGRITHDGPIVSGALLERPDGGVLVALVGVEDHPLDRSGGSFGFVDPFAFVYALEGDRLARRAAIDLGELGLLTPRVVELAATPDGELALWTAGFGSDRSARLRVALSGEDARIDAAVGPGLIGTAAVAHARDGRRLLVSPLADAVAFEGEAPLPLGLADDAPACDDGAALRLGEALFYTEAMGPFQRSTGPLSRFTCETCHVEGGIDGRIHATGRGDVKATTKPLFGLGQNGPLFTRALDRDLATMVYAEFRVAAANTEHDPWFSLRDVDLPWLATLPLGELPEDPGALREALVRYLAALPPPPNARARGKAAFDAQERSGAALFAARCEGCHAARLVADEPATRVPPESWEALVLSDAGPIVWARDGYEVSGIEPRVHPLGARPSSLRRIADKTPYFTNGSARSLAEVLARGHVEEGRFLHRPAGDGAGALDAREAAALEAFLRLL